MLRALAVIVLLLAAPAAASAHPITASFETQPLFDDDAGGNANADDPAIWVDRRVPARSIVVGTKKDAGLTAFDLQGRTLQDIAPPPDGRFNNVDIVGDLAIVTDRGRDTLRMYRVGRPLKDVTVEQPPLVFSADAEEVEVQATAYGLAAFRAHGHIYAVVSRRSRTEVALLRLVRTHHRYSYTEVDRLSLPSSFRLPDGTTWTPCEDPGDLPQVEGSVVDADRGVAFLAQEDVGIWKVGVGRRSFSGRPMLIDRVREYGVPGTFDEAEEECVAGADPGFGGRHLSADAEGLTIYRGRSGRGYLLASSQGDDTFAVYADRGRGPFIGSFAIEDGKAADGVQASDGAAVTSRALGPWFPRGLLVTHDGENTPTEIGEDGEPREGTNFKLTRWDKVANAFRPPLLVEPF